MSKIKPDWRLAFPNLPPWAYKFRSITASEYRTLELLITGALNKVIAAELRVTEQVVKNRLSSLYAKLQAKNRVELVMKLLAVAKDEEEAVRYTVTQPEPGGFWTVKDARLRADVALFSTLMPGAGKAAYELADVLNGKEVLRDQSR